MLIELVMNHLSSAEQLSAAPSFVVHCVTVASVLGRLATGGATGSTSWHCASARCVASCKAWGPCRVLLSMECMSSWAGQPWEQGEATMAWEITKGDT